MKSFSIGENAAEQAPAQTPQLMQLYRQMVLLRQFELKAQECYRRGEMPGFIHLYVGEEAVAAGVCAHLRKTDWITSTHRGHGHALAKGMPPRVLMAELYAKSTGCCGGRGGSMHLYDPSIGLFGTNGIVVGGNPSAVGAALSAKTRGTDGVAVAFFGDGGVNHGAFHESINLAAVLHAPVIFVCENNLYATATPLRNVTLNPEIASKAQAYGIPGIAVDGNDVLAVHEAAERAVARARAGRGPTLIEAKTYRYVGHHEGDPVAGVYRSQQEIDAWMKRDPIGVLRARVLADIPNAGAKLDAIHEEVTAEVEEAVQFARNSPLPDPATAHRFTCGDAVAASAEPAAQSMRTLTWLEAVRDGIAEEMRRDPHLIYFGEGTGERGGSFGHTKGLWQEFGASRMIDTPISELGFTGAAIGAGATGCRAVADLMFADFLFEAAGQIVLQASKLRYISNNQMSSRMVVRAGSGTVKSTGPHHSGTYHAIWAHMPGLLVAMPSNPADAKGLMKTALRSNDPVIFLEPKILFSTKGAVPEGEVLVPFGLAAIARAGTDLTVVACGWTVHLTLEAAATLAAEGIEIEIVDLRTIVPLDLDTVVRSVTKTTRLLIVDEGYSMCGLGAEIAQSVVELAPDALDAPIARLHTDPVSHPFSPSLEPAVLVTPAKIAEAARRVVAGLSLPQRRVSAASQQAGAKSAEPQAPTQRQAANAVADSSSSTPKRESPILTPRANEQVLNLPHGDLTVTEATVVQWLKKAGDAVARGEPVVEVETAKAIMPVEADVDGVLLGILAPVDTVVKMGGPLALLRKS